MNLALDFGNTRIKAGLFSEGRLQKVSVYRQWDELLNGLPEIKIIQHCIIGSVTGAHEKAMSELSRFFPVSLFTPQSRIPLTNRYTSALTLGSDRLAASIGAFCLSPNQNVLTIDAGTCIKYNFVNDHNEYLGGAISPGIPMRLKAMNHYTHALPLVDADPEYDLLIGSNTRESLLSGAITATAAEADGMIQRYAGTFPDLVVYITGGDAAYLCKQVKSRFFANQNLLLKGLNAILELNLES